MVRLLRMLSSHLYFPRGTVFLVSKRWTWLIAVSGLLGSESALASVVRVPDDFATIQAAVDSGADTVVIRDGTYAETPSAYRGVVLIGAGNLRPRLDGLAISNPYEWLSLNWSIVGIDFTGPVTISTFNVHGRNINVALSDCTLDSGLQHVLSDDIYDINLLSLTRCRLPTACYARATDVSMQADTIDAGVRWTVNGVLRVSDCWFRGGPGRALDIDGDVIGGQVTSCLFENYRVSLHASYLDSHSPGGFLIASNVIRRMNDLALAAGCYAATLADNVVVDCSEGVRIGLVGRLQLYNNTVLRCGGYGFWLDQPEIVQASGNVIGHCGGSAITLESASYADLSFTHNTFVKNAGSGIDMLVGSVMNNVIVQGNVAAWNAEYGLLIRRLQPSVTLGCNDWFANARGSVLGTAINPGDWELDPFLCNVETDDMNLFSDSPLLSRPGCGQIGARGTGCTPPTLRVLSVSSVRAGLGVAWELEAASTVESWIERSDQAGGQWDSLGVGALTGSNSLELLDAAVAPDRTYNYRVTWRDRGAVVHSSPVSAKWTDAGKLSSVMPNPAFSEVAVEWILARPGSTDIRIFDLAGREVSMVARGTFGVGRHQVRWDGRWEGRGAAPAGMYIVRVSSADRTTSHRILLLR